MDQKKQNQTKKSDSDNPDTQGATDSAKQKDSPARYGTTETQREAPLIDQQLVDQEHRAEQENA